jgi:hypothetical protein
MSWESSIECYRLLIDTTHIHASAGLDYAFNPAAAS